MIPQSNFDIELLHIIPSHDQWQQESNSEKLGEKTISAKKNLLSAVLKVSDEKNTICLLYTSRCV